MRTCLDKESALRFLFTCDCLKAHDWAKQSFAFDEQTSISQGSKSFISASSGNTLVVRPS